MLTSKRSSVGKPVSIIKTTLAPRIAGTKTTDDWAVFRQSLTGHTNRQHWEATLRTYFNPRLSWRYLKPIDLLLKNGQLRGEGFSILAIECSLIEFLESTIQGRNYRYWRRGDPPLPAHEYYDSKEMFVSFLTNRSPFAQEFNRDLAIDFYKGVRCGLMHEARTKGGWTIAANSPIGRVISPSSKVVYRNDFHDAILDFIRTYRRAIVTNPMYQAAFIRKFDGLCRD
jgi:hypothetical protein